MQEVAQAVAVREAERHVRPQRGLPGLTGAERIRLAAIRDVAKNHDRPDQDRSLVHRRARVLDRKRRSIARLELVSVADGNRSIDERRAREKIVLRRRRPLQPELMQNRAHRFADQLGGGPARQPRRRVIHEGDRALDVYAENAISGGVEEEFAALADLRDFVFGPPRRAVMSEPTPTNPVRTW
jgi:hypothetical protein